MSADVQPIGTDTGQRSLVSRLRDAVSDLLTQEFRPSTGHLTTVLHGCLFAPSLLTFWFVNGVIDFSTALAIGAVGSPAGLQVRLLAYVLLVPVFLVLRMGLHLLDPDERREVLSGSCPSATHLSLDWFSVGILATGLPLALQHLGPWLGLQAVLLLGVFVLPRALPRGYRTGVRASALLVGPALFAYARFGGLVAGIPDPAATLGPLATLTLSDATTAALLRIVNSLLVGPLLVAAFAVLSNRVLTRPELREVPLIRYALPDRDLDRVAVVSAALGTVFYLLVVAVTTGRLVVVP